MDKKIKLKCRPSDPPQYSGIFKVEAEFLFKERSGIRREMRLEDGRIVVIKPIADRVKYIVFHPHCHRARDHAIKDVTLLYSPAEVAHA